MNFEQWDCLKKYIQKCLQILQFYNIKDFEIFLIIIVLFSFKVLIGNSIYILNSLKLLLY